MCLVGFIIRIYHDVRSSECQISSMQKKQRKQINMGTPRKNCVKPTWQYGIINGQRNCPKHVQSYSKNKFEKFVHLVGFIIRIYHDARSPVHQYITMHGHLYINISRCTVTCTSIYHDARSSECQTFLRY